jgi:hypothetical protein
MEIEITIMEIEITIILPRASQTHAWASIRFRPPAKRVASEQLCRKVFRIKQVKKKHRVSVLRALKEMSGKTALNVWRSRSWQPDLPSTRGSDRARGDRESNAAEIVSCLVGDLRRQMCTKLRLAAGTLQKDHQPTRDRQC